MQDILCTLRLDQIISCVGLAHAHGACCAFVLLYHSGVCMPTCCIRVSHQQVLQCMLSSSAKTHLATRVPGGNSL